MSAAISVLLDALRQYHLLEPAQLDELTRWSFPQEPRRFAEDLLRRGWLTPLQANHLLQGRAAELVFGSYVLLERLGQGGMGQVFKARNWKLGRVVALKLIRKERLANEEAIRRFQREIRATAQLAHQNIVRAYDADESGGTHFFVMEYAEGQDLACILAQRGALSIDEACHYIRQAALGLQHAHEQGLVHRDVKPHNLLLTRQGVVKILDLGLAQSASSGGEDSGTITQQGMVMGTLDYIAPEQALESHAVDIRADLYSLGCTFYHLLAGRPPFPGGGALEKLYKHRHEAPTPIGRLRPDVPPAVAGIVHKLLAKHPADRYQTPRELVAALAQPMESGPVVEAEGNCPLPLPSSATGGLSGETADSAFTDLALDDAGNGAEPLRRPQQQQRREWSLSLVLLSSIGLVALLALTVLLYLVLGSRAVPKENAGAAKKPALQASKDEEPKPRAVLEGHTAGVLALAFLPRSGLLVSGSEDRTIKLWKVSETGGRLLDTLHGHAGPVVSLACVADGTILAAASKQTIHVWNPATRTEWRRIETRHPALRCLVFALASSSQAMTVGEDNAMPWWDLATGEQIGGRFLPAPGCSLAFCPDGQRWAVGRADGTVRLCNHDPTKEPPDLPAHRGAVKALAWSPTGAFVASGGADGLVKLWLPSGEQRNVFSDHKGEIHSLAFSPEGKLLASASADGSVRLWTVSGKLKTIFRGHPRGAGAVAFSLEGKTLASGDGEGKVYLWDVTTAWEN
jgi:serine/threonine protein kinase